MKLLFFILTCEKVISHNSQNIGCKYYTISDTIAQTSEIKLYLDTNQIK